MASPVKIEFKKERIVAYLARYKDRLEELYDGKPHFEGLVKIKVINEKQYKELESKATTLQKEERLKGILSRELQTAIKNKARFRKIALWIIRKWGGIRGGSDDETMKSVMKFLKDPESTEFNRISSVSKIWEFMHPGKYIIYDSRVSYAMNWILLSQKAGNRFFPVPEGRNSKTQAFDIRVLIRLMHHEKYRRDDDKNNTSRKLVSEADENLFIPKDIAYREMNRLIREVNAELWDNDRKNKPFYTEILLFAMADKVVFDEITRKVSLEINDDGKNNCP